MRNSYPWWYIRNTLACAGDPRAAVSPYWHVRNIFIAWAVSVVWVLVISTIFQLVFASSITIGPNSPIMSLVVAWSSQFPNMQTMLQESIALQLFFTLVFAPVVEETLFRVLPLTFVKNCDWDIIRAVVFGVCGIIFGWMHGSPVNVLFQGFGGLMLAWVYLRNRTSPLAGYLSAVVVHFLYNATVTLFASIF